MNVRVHLRTGTQIDLIVGEAEVNPHSSDAIIAAELRQIIFSVPHPILAGVTFNRDAVEAIEPL